MTVFNQFNQYSSIDEAYGFLNPQMNPKNKKNSPTACKLYDMQNSDSELVTYANQYKKAQQAIVRPSESYAESDLSHQWANNLVQSRSTNTTQEESVRPLVTSEESYQRPSQIISEEVNPIYAEMFSLPSKPSSEQTYQEFYPYFNVDKVGREGVTSTHIDEKKVTGEIETAYNFRPSNLMSNDTPHIMNIKKTGKCPDVYIQNNNDNSNRMLAEENNPNDRSHSRPYDEDELLRMLSNKYMKEYTTAHSSKSTESVNYIDLILYIISGIILIFMMEQFVKLGTQLAI
jgi:hypothetical protein